MIDQKECPSAYIVLPKTNHCDGCCFKKDGMVCIRNEILNAVFHCSKERRKDECDVIFDKKEIIHV